MSIDLKAIGIAALKSAHQTINQLGSDGEEEIEKNQFGEVAMRADIEAEDAVIATCREYGLPIRIVSEEHGVLDIGSDPAYLGILDGLDGSGVYKRTHGAGRYGTMFSIFSCTDPCYDDYVFSGIIEHSTSRLVYGMRGEGAFVVQLGDGKTVPVHCLDATSLADGMNIYIDDYWEVNRKTFLPMHERFGTACLGSTAAHYLDLACGNTALVLECTRKGNLEVAVAYGLVREAGGVILTLDGQSLGTRRYFSFGQGKEHVPHVAAATEELAHATIRYCRHPPQAPGGQ